MTKSKLYLLLSVSLLSLILIYVVVRRYDPIKSDLYELKTSVYLEKQDYFSKYSILRKTNQGYINLISNVVELSEFKDGYLAKFSKDSKDSFLYLTDKQQIIIEDVLSFKVQNKIDNLTWVKPWHIFESKTLSNPIKLASELILMLITCIGFYFIMKVFDLKRIPIRM